eukprot:749501-Hanusia_phi.AAC.6
MPGQQEASERMEEGGRRRESSKEEEEEDIPFLLVQDHAQALPWKRLLWHLGHWRKKKDDATFMGGAVESGERGEVGKHLKWKFARQVTECMRAVAVLSALIFAMAIIRVPGFLDDFCGTVLPGNACLSQPIYILTLHAKSCIPSLPTNALVQRIVLALDIKGSLATVVGTSKDCPILLLDNMFAGCIRLLSWLPQASGDVEEVLISVIAQGSTVDDVRILCHEELVGSGRLEHLTQKLIAQFDLLKKQMAVGLWCSRDRLDSEKGETRSDLQHLFANSMQLLDSMSKEGCPSVFLLTDGVVTMGNDQSTFLDVASCLRRKDVSVLLCHYIIPELSGTFSHVPDLDFLRKFARACNGCHISVSSDDFVLRSAISAVLTRTTLLGPSRDWFSGWYTDWARGPSAFGGRASDVRVLRRTSLSSMSEWSEMERVVEARCWDGFLLVDVKLKEEEGKRTSERLPRKGADALGGMQDSRTSAHESDMMETGPTRQREGDSWNAIEFAFPLHDSLDVVCSVRKVEGTSTSDAAMAALSGSQASAVKGLTGVMEIGWRAEEKFAKKLMPFFSSFSHVMEMMDKTLHDVVKPLRQKNHRRREKMLEKIALRLIDFVQALTTLDRFHQCMFSPQLAFAAFSQVFWIRTSLFAMHFISPVKFLLYHHVYYCSGRILRVCRLLSFLPDANSCSSVLLTPIALFVLFTEATSSDDNGGMEDENGLLF